MANLKSTKDKQRSTKHTHKTKDRVTHRVKSCASRRVSSFCFLKIYSGGRRIEMCSIVNQSTARKSDQSEAAISGRLANQNPGKRTNQKAGYKKKQPIDCRDTLHSTCHVNQNQDHTKALNIPLTLTQGDLLQEALAVTLAKYQTQALNIPVKVPLGGGRYAELTEWNGSKRVDLRFWKTDTIPTKVGVSLSLPQWKDLYSAMQVVDDLIS